MFVASLLLVSTFAAAPIQARAPRPPQVDETIKVTKGARLTVDNFAGEVAVRSWDRDAVRVIARHGSSNKVSIQSVTGGVAVESRSSRGSVDYEITAPAWMAIRIQGHYNFVNIDGVLSEVHAETTRGDITIKGTIGAVTAKSIQGQVVVEGARGRINASSVNEDVRIRDASGDILVETSNGNVSLMNVQSENIEVSTINGHIAFDGTPTSRGRYRMTTHNGNITVALAEASNVTFIVRTYQGNFSSTLRLNGPPRDEARQGRRNTYMLGNGSAEMELESFGGNIRIRRPGNTTGERQRNAPER